MDGSIEHVNIFMSYKELISLLESERDFYGSACIKGTFIDPSLGEVSQTYINTAAKYGNRIYPLNFTKGIGQYVAKTKIDVFSYNVYKYNINLHKYLYSDQFSTRMQVNTWIDQRTNGSIDDIALKSSKQETSDPHMEVYAVSSISPFRLSIFSNQRTQEKVA